MKNKTLYDKTIAILVKAYLNDTLEQADCQRCAVGNIVADAIGFDLKKGNPPTNDNPFEDTGLWYSFIGYGEIHTPLTSDVKKQIKLTGYSAGNLCGIESAFMDQEFKNDNGKYDKEKSIYMGLLAVVEYLGEIHEVSQRVTEETKLMFVK